LRLAVELSADIQFVSLFFYVGGWMEQTKERKMDFISVCGTITFLTMLGIDDWMDGWWWIQTTVTRYL
jgi:hypothetical protein